MDKTDTSVNIGGILMQNPVTTASGTFGYGTEYGEFYDINLLGALVVKSITKYPRKGNPPSRLIETPAGLLNSIGLANPGIENFINEVLPRLYEISIPVVVSIAGDTIQEYVDVARRLSEEPKTEGLEINISCPNVEHGGMEFSKNARVVKELVAEVDKAVDLPLIVKLSPNVSDITAAASAAVEGGADALSLINTVVGMAVDTESRKPVFKNVVAGLSGPAIRPIGVRAVWEAAGAVDVPLIGMGGISCTDDALQYIFAGASAVAVGTHNFVNPDVGAEIVNGIAQFCRLEGVQNYKELIGCAR